MGAVAAVLFFVLIAVAAVRFASNNRDAAEAAALRRVAREKSLEQLSYDAMRRQSTRRKVARRSTDV